MRKNDGFTLIELLVVIGIIAVLTIGGGGYFLAYLPGYRLDSAVEEMQSTLQMAKLRAIKEAKSTGVFLNPATGAWTAFVDDGAGTGGNANNGVRDGSEVEFRTGTMPTGVTVFSNTFGGNCARFGSRGLPLPYMAGNGSFRFTNVRNRFKGVTMTVSGSISIQQSTDNGATWTAL